MGEQRKNKKPWPTKEAMIQVYEAQLWGKGEDEFYSGEGSHDPLLVEPYLEATTNWLNSFNEQLTVCDLGCGDFNIGKHLVEYSKQYHAVDVVPNLIQRNKQLFKSDRLTFYSLDIAQDIWPQADVVILRQVLQHLSNKEIKSIVEQLTKYRFLILTEHLPEEDFEANQDIISGQGIRIKKKSGVNLEHPPFNLEYTQKSTWLDLKNPKGKGRIVTTLYQLN